jgi:hypothetical protein
MNNKLWVTVAIIAISCAATGAIAQERLGDGALGAVAGALVGGPIGAVAGGVIGYTAGPGIAHSWGLKKHPHYHHGHAHRRSS